MQQFSVSGRTIAALLASLLTAGCVDRLLVEARPLSTADVSFSVSYAEAVQPGPGWTAAYDSTDQVRVRLSRGGVPFHEETTPFVPAADRVALTFEIELEADEEEIGVAFELRRGSDPLFRGDTIAVVLAGGEHEASLSLEPVAAAIDTEAPDGPIALGDTAVVRGAALFSTGDTITTSVTWSVLDPLVLAVLSDGRLNAIGTGEARVVGAYQGRADTTVLSVNAPVVRVCGDGGDAGTVPTLVEAMALVEPGGTIRICDGTHPAADLAVDRPVTIEAEGPGVPVLDPTGFGAAIYIQDMAAGPVTIRGLRFRPALFQNVFIGGAYDQVLIEDSEFEVPTETEPIGERGYASGIFAFDAAGNGIIIRTSTFTGGDIGVHTNAAPDAFVLNSFFTGQANAAVHGPFRRVEGNTMEDCGSGEWCIFGGGNPDGTPAAVEIIGNTIRADLATGDRIETPLAIIDVGSLVIRDNVIEGTGGARLPTDRESWPLGNGILFHAPAGEISGNIVSGGFDGISMSGDVEARDNVVRDTHTAIQLRSWEDVSLTRAHANDFESYVNPFDAAVAGALTCNWWGTPDGPPSADEPVFSPWEVEPIAGTGRECAAATPGS